MLALGVAAAGCSSGGPGEFPAPGRGLWVPDSAVDGLITEFQGKPTVIAPAPHRSLTGDDVAEASALTFDGPKNLWNTNVDGGVDFLGSVTEFTKKQLRALKTDSAPSPTVIIQNDGDGTSMDGPEDLAFDAPNLWVAESGQFNGNAQLDKFLSSQLTGTAFPGPTPNLTLDPLTFEFDFPGAVVFDKPLNLWTVDEGGITNDGQVFEYTHKTITTGLSPGPNFVDPDLAIVDSAPMTPLDEPEAATLDGKGNLWVSNCEDLATGFGNIIQFSKSQISTTGTIMPAPVVTLTATSVPGTTGPTESIDCPQGIIFDGSGNLFVANLNSDTLGSIAKFKKKDIAMSGSPTPTQFIDADALGNNLDGPRLFSFGIKVP